MIAWSFDRVAPSGLGYVSQRVHTPVVAIWLSTAVAVVFMWLIAYQAINLLTLIEALVVVWGTAMLAAVWFPRTRRQLFEMSPASEMRIGSIPTMSITGLIAAAFMAWVLYLLWTDPIAAGPLWTAEGPRPEFWLIVGTVVLGAVWYLGVRQYRQEPGDRHRARLPPDPDRVTAPARPLGWDLLLAETRALLVDAAAKGMTLRVFGSAGVRMHCPPSDDSLSQQRRSPKDIDLVCRREDRRHLRELFAARGYEVDRDLLVAMEGRRYLFRNPEQRHRRRRLGGRPRVLPHHRGSGPATAR